MMTDPTQPNDIENQARVTGDTSYDAAANTGAEASDIERVENRACKDLFEFVRRFLRS
jgi:hypothetical protein